MMNSKLMFLMTMCLIGGSDGDAAPCDRGASENTSYQSYFHGLKRIYGLDDTQYKCYLDCGWPNSHSELPTLVVTVGLEGSGQKMWMSAVFNAMFEADRTICSSDASSGNVYGISEEKNFPVLTPEEVSKSVQKSYSRKCRLLLDVSQSFPMGKKKHTGRAMRHIDLVNIQRLHGVHYNVKYFILLRSVVDSAMVSFSRQSTKTMDHNLRAVEASLVYMESALKNVPCHQKFLAHFEAFRVNPRSFIEPLKMFFNLNLDNHKIAGEKVEESIDNFAKQKKALPPLRIPRDLVARLCNRRESDKKCNKEVQMIYEKFFEMRKHMWPTF